MLTYSELVFMLLFGSFFVAVFLHYYACSVDRYRSKRCVIIRKQYKNQSCVTEVPMFRIAVFRIRIVKFHILKCWMFSWGRGGGAGDLS